jgi:GT2 family glycosyltransferase
MISLVCSTREISPNYEKMIRKSSGLKTDELEILIYVNNGEFSLTQIYNKGLNDAKNDIIVFAHDDIEILSKEWGKKLIKHYNNTDYAILGVAGTKFLDQTGVWWNNKESMYGKVYHTDGYKSWASEYSYNFGDKIKEAVTVDGVFFSCDRARIKKNFDEYYTGFHFYDISFCFENFLEDVKVGVHFDISIKHQSVGEVNDQWNENRLKFIDKEKDNLPQTSCIEVKYINKKVVINDQKKLAIVIPTKNKVDELLIPCIDSIINNTIYENYTIYVADTGSNSSEIEKIEDHADIVNRYRDVVKLIKYDYYNFAKINNDVVKEHIDKDTELILFCNNDIEMINDAISIMIEEYDKEPKVGTVGCRLHLENGSIQHLGISLEKNKNNELKFVNKFTNWDYDNVRLPRSKTYTHGNTGAFMLVSKKLFQEIGGFNEGYSECFEDVEFNLECLLKKKLNVTLNDAVCYHYETQTRERKTESVDVDRLLSFINDHENLKNTFNITN